MNWQTNITYSGKSPKKWIQYKLWAYNKHFDQLHLRGKNGVQLAILLYKDFQFNVEFNTIIIVGITVLGLFIYFFLLRFKYWLVAWRFLILRFSFIIFPWCFKPHEIICEILHTKGKAKCIYIALIFVLRARRLGMDHTFLPAITPLPAFTS